MILSLYDHSGEWARPWVAAGHEVLLVDWQHPLGLTQGTPSTLGLDLSDPRAPGFLVRKLHGRVTGILAAPPCDCFTRASAWLWKRWDADGKTTTNLRMVDHALTLVEALQPKWWVLENPIGRLWKRDGTGLRQAALGEPLLTFDPWEFGALAPEDPSSRRTKRTRLWGDFRVPELAPHPEGKQAYPKHLAPQRRDPIRQMGSRNKAERARTPPGFAHAFYLANNGAHGEPLHDHHQGAPSLPWCADL